MTGPIELSCNEKVVYWGEVDLEGQPPMVVFAIWAITQASGTRRR
jgi:hypothetical protein